MRKNIVEYIAQREVQRNYKIPSFVQMRKKKVVYCVNLRATLMEPTFLFESVYLLCCNFCSKIALSTLFWQVFDLVVAGKSQINYLSRKLYLQAIVHYLIYWCFQMSLQAELIDRRLGIS